MLRSPTNALLLDATRLVWRTWRGRHPTGIDRVCLAYAAHFRDRALAVVQRKGFVFIFSQAQSRRLFDLLLRGRGVSRSEFVRFFARASVSVRRTPPFKGMQYLNVGHTGLNDGALSAWIARNDVKAIHLVHDLIPISNPEFCRPGEAEKHRERITNALESASGLIGNSQATMDELARFAAGKSMRMPASVVAWIYGIEGRQDTQPKAIDRPHFVTVGTIEARKNHLMLLRVWHRLVLEMGVAAPILVIVGQPGWKAEHALGILENLGALERSVVQLDDCDDDELAGWIAGARALLMPSFVEGFGLPVVEALALGTPVIASDLPVFREIVGDIPTYLPPSDEFVWETKIRAFIHNNPEREHQLMQIVEYRPPTWREHFGIVEPWLAKL